MSLLLEREKDTYESIWGIPLYEQEGIKPGLMFVETFLESIDPEPATILDAGCGAGHASVILSEKGHLVTLLDITPIGLSEEARKLPFIQDCIWHDLYPVAYLASLEDRAKDGKFDHVFCCDVMEHLPEALTMLAAHQLLSVARKGAFFSINLQPDVFGAWVGHPLHQTVKPFTWWRDMLGEVGTVTEARDLLRIGLYWVRPR